MTDTQARRISDREMEVTRLFDAPARLVFAAWADPALFRQWWLPQSMGMRLLSCEMDVRTGGGYRLAFDTDPVMEFFGKYLEVIPPSRIVWTNDEEHGDGAVTTVTLEDRGATTLLTLRETYPTKESLDAALAQGAVGMADGMPEQFGQLDALLAAQ